MPNTMTTRLLTLAFCLLPLACPARAELVYQSALNSPWAGHRTLACSPDGSNLFLVTEGAIHAIYRDPYGNLSLEDSEYAATAPGVNGGVDVAVRPDDKVVCTAGTYGDAVSSFAISPGSTGNVLTYVATLTHDEGEGGAEGLDAPQALEFSPDGKHLYVLATQSDMITVINVSASGQLTVEQEIHNSGLVYDMEDPHDVRVSPDGRFVYVASVTDNAITCFLRNTDNGRLLFINSYQDGDTGIDNLRRPHAMVISPDGKFLYVAAGGDSALNVFSRNLETGALTQADSVLNSDPGVDGLASAWDLAISPDGKKLYAAGHNSGTYVPSGTLGIFSRNPTTGLLTIEDVIYDGIGDVDSMYGANSVVVSPDSRDVYVGAWQDGAVTFFQNDAKTLFFPYVACVEPWDTEICLINDDFEPVSGELLAFDNQGNQIGSMDIVLDEDERRQLLVSEEFLFDAFIRYMTFVSTSGDIVGYTKFFREGLMRGAIPASIDLWPESDKDLLIPHVGYNEQWWTGLGLVNDYAMERDVGLTFNQGSSATVELDPLGQTSFNVDNLFDTPPSGIETCRIAAMHNLYAMELFGSGNMLAGTAINNEVSPTLYYPHVAPNDGGQWWTGLVAYNPDVATNFLTITAYSEAGAELYTAPRILAPGNRLISSAQALGLPSATAWVKIEGTQGLSGMELFGTADGNMLAGFNVTTINSRSGLLPKIDRTGWTGISFVNTGEDSVTISLRAYDDSGDQVAFESMGLSAHAKFLGTAEDLFPDDDISEATYIRYIVSPPEGRVAAFQLNGSTDGMMLDALPALR